MALIYEASVMVKKGSVTSKLQIYKKIMQDLDEDVLIKYVKNNDILGLTSTPIAKKEFTVKIQIQTDEL